jgi:hypothetical protein
VLKTVRTTRAASRLSHRQRVVKTFENMGPSWASYG